MMHSTNIFLLSALIVHAYAKDAQETMDTVTDKLFSPVTSIGAPLGAVAQPTMAGRPFLSSLRGTTSRVQAAKDNLKMFGIGSSPLENLALTAIDATNRRGFDVSARAKL